MKELLKLEDREKFVVGLIIVNGGTITHEKLVNILLRARGPFQGLNKKYVKYTLVGKTIHGLANKKYLNESEIGVYVVAEFVKSRFVDLYSKDLLEILSIFSEYRKAYHLEFDLAEIEEGILDPKWDEIPYEVVEHIKQAIKIYNRTSSYDSVITKCAKIMEILVRNINKKYALVDKNRKVTEIIAEFKNPNVTSRIKHKEDREAFTVFANSAYLIYKYRSKMGAHEDWWWGINQVALSCLLLTFYLVDLFVVDLQDIECK